MGEKEDFKAIYRDLRYFYANSGDLASAILPFIDHTRDFELAATMLHSQIQLFKTLRK
ncbi:MAG: hypothetical protein ACI9FJ_000618 [Alteromonadaceae bacterium]|jgi:hypothetical protein